MKNTLYRDEQNKVIGGVCAGLANYFGIDISLARVIFVLFSIVGGSGLLVYIIMWIVVPAAPYGEVSYGDSFDAPLKPGAYVTKKGPSTGAVIAGATLIVLGIFFLLDQFNFIPDIEFHKFWPVVLIAIGLVFIFGYWKKHPVAEQPADNRKNMDDNLTTDNTQNI
jgi:phage shock protein C